MSIKGMTLKLSVAVMAFTLGVVIATVYRLRNSVSPVAAPKVEARAEFPQHACYPGKSIPLQDTGKLRYFPPEAMSEFPTEWYSRHLTAMEEGSMLAPDKQAVESYRFLWLRSFHHPVAVRVWRSETDQFITVKEMSGAGGYEPGRFVVNRTRKLAPGEWDAFIRPLDDSCYWNLSTDDPNERGFDGAQWILEGVKGGRYHIVDRWTPTSGSFREACLHSLKLSGLAIDTKSEPLY
jgi:hypothetical protein